MIDERIRIQENYDMTMETAIDEAREVWTNTVIGIIMFAFMVAITNFIIPGGVFD